MTKKTLRALIVEDSQFDAHLLVHFLRKAGYDLAHERVDTEEAMKASLTAGQWDLVISDYNLPQFDALGALEILKEARLDIPFIIVSGGIGENVAVDAMKAGAHDYVMKGNLARLIPAVERELREAANREEKRQASEALRQSELRYRLLWESATDAILLMDAAGAIHFANPAVKDVFGYAPEELAGHSLEMLQPQRLRGALEELMQPAASGEKRLKRRATDSTGLRKDGTEFPIEVAFSEMELQGERWRVGFIRDVTERQRAEQELLEHAEQFRVAREIQQHLFPRTPPAIEGFEIAGSSHPAEATGGDYFDYLPMLHGQTGAVVGDVTGHGVGPALLMAEARACLRVLAKNRSDAGEILTRANAVLAEDLGPDRFVTLLLAQIDPQTRTLCYANAGHPPGCVLSAAGEVKMLLKRTGIPLGLRPATQYSSVSCGPLASGDIIVLLSDGFEETVAPDDTMFGMERVLNVIRERRSAPAREIVDALYAAVSQFSQNADQADDLTVIIAKVK